MTGYTVHTGASEKFVEGWDRIFGGSRKSSNKSSHQVTPAKHSPAKSAKKTETAQPAAQKRSKGTK
jgi:hypothetical protein